MTKHTTQERPTMHRYLIHMPGHAPFTTARFDPENHFVEGMVVFDLHTCRHTTDGKTWLDIGEDNL